MRAQLLLLVHVSWVDTGSCLLVADAGRLGEADLPGEVRVSLVVAALGARCAAVQARQHAVLPRRVHQTHALPVPVHTSGQASWLGIGRDLYVC